MTAQKKEKLARSAHRVWRVAQGLPEAALDDEGHVTQAGWLGVAANAEAILLKFQGASPIDAARELCGTYHDASLSQQQGLLMFGALCAVGRLAWEAVARHLLALLDAEDEIAAGEIDLADLEQSWGPWARARHGSPIKAEERKTA